MAKFYKHIRRNHIFILLIHCYCLTHLFFYPIRAMNDVYLFDSDFNLSITKYFTRSDHSTIMSTLKLPQYRPQKCCKANELCLNSIADTTRGRSANWTSAEDRFLCKAWCRASDDTIIGTNRTGNTFWNDVGVQYHEVYNAQGLRPPVDRSTTQIKGWKSLK